MLNRFTGKPVETTFLGEASEHVLLVGQEKIKVIVAPPLFQTPDHLTVAFEPQDVLVLPD